jgi:hypothetical protein
MRRLSATLVVLLFACAAFAKEKPRVNVQVVETQTSDRQYTSTVAGTAGTSTTTCNANGNQTVYGTSRGSTVKGAVNTNSTSTCTTTSRPATPPTTQVRSIRQEHVQAIMEDGTHVTLWCQAGLRKCVSLHTGAYSAEVDGNTVWIYIRDLSGKEQKLKYKAVSVDSDSASSTSQDGA